MSDWQPIETAPKDGDKVLLLMRGHHIRSGRWISNGSLNWWGWWEGSDNDDPLQPTHWMPLPEPPK